MRALLGFVGDVIVDHEDPSSVFRHVDAHLHSVDMLFGNQECPYTDDPHPAPSAIFAMYAPVASSGALGAAGFDVMSMANNHIVDAGHRAMLDTREILQAQGIATAGAGADIDDARRPARAKARDYDVAVLAYSSTFPPGYEARHAWPGLAPMRSSEVLSNVGNRMRRRSPIPQKMAALHHDDVLRLQADVAAAREGSDIVVASFHWGDVETRFTISDHERRVARVAIEAGADIVVGHHHHTLRGMEWYRGKPIFYGLGHFIFNFSDDTISRIDDIAGGLAHVADDDDDASNYGHIEPHEGWPLLPFHKDTRMTAIAWCEVVDGAPVGAGFLPCLIEPDGAVRPHDPRSPEGQQVIDYFREACESEQMPIRVEVDDDIRLGGLPTVRLVSTADPGVD